MKRLEWKVTIEYVDGSSISYEDATVETHESGKVIKLVLSDATIMFIPMHRIKTVIGEQIPIEVGMNGKWLSG